jgi:hypothetical protein
MTNLPIESIDELDFEDLGVVAEELQSFLEILGKASLGNSLYISFPI